MGWRSANVVTWLLEAANQLALLPDPERPVKPLLSQSFGNKEVRKQDQNTAKAESATVSSENVSTRQALNPIGSLKHAVVPANPGPKNHKPLKACSVLRIMSSHELLAAANCCSHPADGCPPGSSDSLCHRSQLVAPALQAAISGHLEQAKQAKAAASDCNYIASLA